MSEQTRERAQPICRAVASTGQRCQLPEHHNSPHRVEDDYGRLTWEPAYVGDFRRELEDGAWRWRGLLADVLAEIPDAWHSEAIDDAREALNAEGGSP